MRCTTGVAILLGTGALTAQEPAGRPVNRLAQATSPYLLQHRHNPVDWYPWGAEALQRAKDDDKPIFLSIGYSACHWCHVMERESFENPEIAALMNEHFVNIKVDREERPDLDEIYMAAVQGLTGRGGWPMSVWLTPDLEPFYAGTYFPDEERYGLPAFPRVLQEVARAWRESRADIERSAASVVEYVQRRVAPATEPGEGRHEQVDFAVQQSAGRHDAEFGGFAAAPAYAPKFPHASEISMLLRHHARTGDEQSLLMAELSLTRMAEGGIYDQLGGGFHRYATDRHWLVPHFEKMLYDNAQLARTYAEAYQLTGKPLYGRIARETLDYLLREMQDGQGGFWSSQDADSEGVEGKFFVWTKAEVEQLLGERAEVAVRYWGVTEEGNWEDVNVLSVAVSLADVAAALQRDPDAVRADLAAARRTLLEARRRRVAPGTDDKVLAAWNGLAIAAFAVGYQTLDEPRYLEAAQRAADFVLREMRADGRLLRSWRAGRASLPGYLDDYAFVAEGLLCLFEADFDPRWLDEAIAALDQVRDRFLDPADGSFFFTADDHEQLVARSKNVSETSTPAGIAVAVLGFLRAGLLTGDLELEEVGLRALRSNHSVLERSPLASPSLVQALQFSLGDPREVVVVGEPDDPRTVSFLRVVRAEFPPHRVVALLHSGNRERLRALADIYVGKEPVDGAAAVYVCRRGVCEAPVLDPGQLFRR